MEYLVKRSNGLRPRSMADEYPRGYLLHPFLSQVITADVSTQ